MQETLGHYRVLEPIGSGGMGTVYRARDERLERDVAIKVLSGVGPIDEEARRRFRREALALSKLNHPNVATIHDFDTFGEMDVLVMEHIPGRDLADALREGPLPEREIARLGQQLVSALEAAHARGVIHRDLKPGNIRITPDGRVKVLDFGLAQALQLGGDATTASLSAPGFAGTLPYMAPEQVRGDAVDARTDIYGAGAVLYEMATGSRVHPGVTGPRLLGAILESTPVPAPALNPRISPALDRILTKALDKDPQLRYQSAREMRVDLERLAAPEKALAPPPVWRRPRTLAIAGVAVALLAAVAAGGWLWWPRAEPFTGRILVADFEDRANDPELALVIRDLFTLQLQQSRHLNVLSRDQVVDALTRMERSGRDPLDVRTAVELAEREAIPLLLAGTARRSGDSVLISVQGMDVHRTLLFTETTEYSTEADLRRSISALAEAVRQGLGESLTGIARASRPLDEVTTSSLTALKLYSRGAEAARQGDPDEALRLLSTTLELDPGFAMAHRAIARVYGTRGNPPLAREHLEHAYTHRGRLTERERLLVEGSYFQGRGEHEKAIASLTAATNLYPTDSEARYELAIAYRYAGETQQAIERLEEILVTDPMFTVAYGVLVLQLARDGHYDRAAAVYEQARQRGIEAAQLEWGYGMVMLGRNQLEEARQRFHALEGYSRVYSGIARFNLTTVDVLEGHFAGAVDRLQADILGDRQSGDLAAEIRRRYLLGQLLLLRGRRPDVAAQVAHMLEAGKDRLGADEWLMAGTLLVALDELPRARDVLTELHHKRTEAPSGFIESCYQNLAGEIALAGSQSRDAVQAFSSAAAHYPGAATTRGLARAFMAEQDWPRARDAWTSVIESRGELLQYGLAADWVLAHLERARASRAMADVPAARADYETFLGMWPKAGDLPVVGQALAEYRSLPLTKS